MENDNPTPLEPMPTFVFEPGAAGAMKLTMSISDGSYVWAAVDAESWDTLKAKGDQAMADTLRITAEESGGA